MARELNRSAATTLPPLVLLTDDERLPDPFAAIRALPCGSLVIVRARSSARRAALATSLAPLFRERSLKWIIADDPLLAADTGAHGVHFPEAKIPLAARWRVRRPRWLITCSAHSLPACGRAVRAGADAILLAPIFATGSHPGRSGLGSLHARLIASIVPAPIYALGGIDAHSAKRLAGAPLAGLAAVHALRGDRCPGTSGCASHATTV